MCVIVHQPAGKRLSKHDAKALWTQNPDGGSVAYPHGKRVIVVKAMTFPQWWQSYRSVTQKHPNVDVMVHMRIATHGSVSLDNVHPFPLGEDGLTVVAHNGVIWDCLPNKWEDRSDTRVFVEDALTRLPADWLDDYYLTGMVEAYTSGSRLMFLTVDPALDQTVYRLGRWETRNGLWLSNTYGLSQPKHAKTTGKTSTLVYGNGYKWGNKWKWDTGTVETTKPQSSPFKDVDPDTLDDAAYDQWLEDTYAEYAWSMEDSPKTK